MHKSLARIIAALLLIAVSSSATAQDIRYSWFDIAFDQQDVGKSASFADIVVGQSVDIATTDGSGIRFQGSVGTWHNLFAYVDFKSSDINVTAVVTNSLGQFTDSDEFDYTSVRGGVGLRWPLTLKTDIYGLVTYDSTDFDFGSFAGEDFDIGEKDIGATLGVRSLFGDKVELRASVRYSGVGDVDLSNRFMAPDTLFGVGFGYELIRGLSITGDFESGQFSSWNIGFRLDLDEN